MVAGARQVLLLQCLEVGAQHPAWFAHHDALGIERFHGTAVLLALRSMRSFNGKGEVERVIKGSFPCRQPYQRFVRNRIPNTQIGTKSSSAV